MANSFGSSLNQMVVALLILCLLIVPKSDAKIGVCYGMNGDNLPPPTEVISLCRQNNIQRIRLFNPNQQVLQALQGSNIEVVLGVADGDISYIAASQANADQWVQQNVRAYNNVRFKYITVGNEVKSMEPYLLPAMQNIYNAVYNLGIKVSTALDLGVLGKSYPPSAGTFSDQIMPFIKPIIDFLVLTNGPACFNVHPYFAYVSDPTNIHLDYALGTATTVVVQDGPYAYLTLFDAMVDAVYVALGRVGGESLTVVVTETGWPSEGGVGTTLQNAALYNSKLVPHSVGGTPRRLGRPVETYIFDLFDEDRKTPLVEQHWGLFYPNKLAKYPISFN